MECIAPAWRTQKRCSRPSGFQAVARVARVAAAAAQGIPVSCQARTHAGSGSPSLSEVGSVTKGDFTPVSEKLKAALGHHPDLRATKDEPPMCFSIADDEHPQCKPIRSPQFQAIEEDPKPRDVLEENEALRLALGECWQRLQELEAERADFNSEGVFDLVNSLCHGVKAGRFRHVAGEGPELSSCEHEP
ncbi:unnamed protein product [Durusdinium trenchii]|uniref:Uncharacterized protein n=1 Tax=Durusdinium trenchii TaxID=1381693 RepID=A0ABP0LZF9_9DINO